MNNSEQQAISIRHNAAEHRFETDVEGHLCVAEYHLRPGEIIFTHTFVPPELRGRGIAEKLVRTALEYARDQRLKIVPACSYVAAYIQRHREFAPIANLREP